MEAGEAKLVAKNEPLTCAADTSNSSLHPSLILTLLFARHFLVEGLGGSRLCSGCEGSWRARADDEGQRYVLGREARRDGDVG